MQKNVAAFRVSKPCVGIEFLNSAIRNPTSRKHGEKWDTRTDHPTPSSQTLPELLATRRIKCTACRPVAQLVQSASLTRKRSMVRIHSGLPSFSILNHLAPSAKFRGSLLSVIPTCDLSGKGLQNYRRCLQTPQSCYSTAPRARKKATVPLSFGARRPPECSSVPGNRNAYPRGVHSTNSSGRS
jgi:hypothetical protein